MDEKTFKLTKPVEIDGLTHDEVTMRSFKGTSVAEAAERREELVEAGNARAPLVMCSISSGAPRELFERMEAEDYIAIVRFMKPHFQKFTALVGNATTTKAPPKTSSSSP